MICDHLVCQALGQSCELTYGEAPEGSLDKHEDAPPEERLEQLERELAAIDIDALRMAIRAERARRKVAQLFEDIVMHEKYELSLTHDADQRRVRDSKLLGKLRALTVDPAPDVPPVTASMRAPLRTPDAT
ncbi:MAG TPA: hypothetical protein VH143_00545 [Kofleriaceae bacterium]|jgi:hypothetical protein|nr:hypothetical protein [Kofleriaceae bacterium]